jgi:hypothetical protein
MRIGRSTGGRRRDLLADQHLDLRAPAGPRVLKTAILQ